MKIFLSYGHDVNAPLIEKIKEFLSKDAEGNLKHEVWIDTSEIKAGKDWPEKIIKRLYMSAGQYSRLTNSTLRRNNTSVVSFYKKTILFMCLFHVLLIANAQSTLKGIAVEQNSGYTLIPNVSVSCDYAEPITTDVAGAFTLIFSNIPYGHPVPLVSICKEGWEIVNNEEILNWVTSKDLIYRIVLCKSGTLSDARQKYYNLGTQNYKQLYEKKKKEIKEQKKKNNIMQDEYERQIGELDRQYRRIRQKLLYYADKFARINRDDLSEIENKAVEYVDKGEIDKAITIYESSRIVETFEKQLNLRDSIALNIQHLRKVMLKQMECYKLDGSQESMQKCDSIQRVYDSY